MKDQTKLGGLFYPVKDQLGNDIPWDSLYIPAIYKEIWQEGIFLDVLNQQKDMTIIDCGSNIGITIDHFRKYAKKVYGIEPSPEHFQALKKNKEFNNWTNVELHEVALADKSGELEFSQNVNNRTMNSVKGALNYAGYTDSIKVKAISIEDFFEQNKIESADFIKLDCEGMEGSILRSEGFKKVMPKIKAIMVEFHHSDWQELVNYMISLGFEAKRYDASAVIVLFTHNV